VSDPRTHREHVAAARALLRDDGLHALLQQALRGVGYLVGTAAWLLMSARELVGR
jgi:hypothetical protein